MNSQLKNILKVLAPAAALVSVPAMAVPINEWGFNVASVWIDVVSDDGACTTSGVAPCDDFAISDNVVAWSDDDDDTSSIVLGNNPASGSVLTVDFNGVTINTAGAVGVSNTVTHNNNPLDGDTNSLDSVQLVASVIVTPLDPVAGALGVQMFEFPIEFLETSNNGTNGLCEDGNPVPAGGCEDIYIVDGAS